MVNLTLSETGHAQPAAGTLEKRQPADKPMIDKLTEPIGKAAKDSRQDAKGKFAYASGSRPIDGYTIKRGVGRGGFGEVYYATSDGGKEVALKLVRRNLEIELRGASQCLNLKHPNLVGLYDIKSDPDGDSWLIMEYVADESLAEAIDRHPDGMPIKDVLYWFHGVAAGVAYLHDHGVVHRDLKPGNIFSDQSIVKVGDYGLSKFISVSRRSGQTESVGTVHYMAPEVGNGRYGKEIDVYALGIILYEMLTGRVPFEGESVGEILMKHLTADPDLRDVAEPFRSVIARALTKDPDARLKTVDEMVSMLPAGEQNTYTPRASTFSPSSPKPSVEPHKNPATAFTAEQAAAVKRVESLATEASADEEPVMRLMLDSWQQVRDYWDVKKQTLSPLAKLGILAAGTFGLLVTAQVWIPALFVLTLVYCGYRVVRFVVLSFTDTTKRDKEMTETLTSVGTPPIEKRKHRRRSWHEKKHAKEPAKSSRQKITELIGSLLLSAAVVLGMSLLVMTYQGTIEQYHLFAWIAATSIAGVWAVLIPAKAWEGTIGEPALRRFTMMALGLCVGAIGFGLDHALTVDMLPVVERWRGEGFNSPTREPGLAQYMAYFGIMYLILRWWLQAEPLRTARLSLVSTAWIIMVAWAVHLAVPFPQPVGVMIFANIAVATQLAATWNNPRAGAVRLPEEV
ncbi:MAG: serine/threonine protein kinase [Pirellulales bacterium]|nr:serine/threonine protein kinase [Pirellulales bacterium]